MNKLNIIFTATPDARCELVIRYTWSKAEIPGNPGFAKLTFVQPVLGNYMYATHRYSLHGHLELFD